MLRMRQCPARPDLDHAVAGVPHRCQADGRCECDAYYTKPHCRRLCHTSLPGDYGFETCGGFCKSERAADHCKYCKCRTCAFCILQGDAAARVDASSAPQLEQLEQQRLEQQRQWQQQQEEKQQQQQQQQREQEAERVKQQQQQQQRMEQQRQQRMEQQRTVLQQREQERQQQHRWVVEQQQQRQQEQERLLKKQAAAGAVVHEAAAAEMRTS